MRGCNMTYNRIDTALWQHGFLHLYALLFVEAFGNSPDDGYVDRAASCMIMFSGGVS